MFWALLLRSSLLNSLKESRLWVSMIVAALLPAQAQWPLGVGLSFFANVDANLPTVTVPSEWVNFFTLLMLKQGSYDWAKDFLTSDAWAILQNYSGNVNSFSFSLPPKKPSVVLFDISCSPLEYLSEATAAVSFVQTSMEGDQDNRTEEHSTPPPASSVCKTPPKGKRGKRVPISKADLRSSRLHNQHKGFKSSICKDKNCLGCTPNPLCSLLP